MELLKEQKQEISILISGLTKYRETYYEIYDHVLNELSTRDEKFSLDLVNHILIESFGTRTEIIVNETVYVKDITRRYFQFFNQEILNTFKWPDIAANLSLVLIWVVLRESLNIMPMTKSIGIIVLLMCFFYYFKRYLLDRNERKPSLKYSFLQSSTSFGVSIYVFIFFLFLSKDSLMDISINFKMNITLGLFCFTSVYLRAFIKLYNKKLKVLTA